MCAATLRKLARVLPRGGARALGVLSLVFLTLPLQTAHAATSPFASAMDAAAASRGVPVAIVSATAFVNTRWEWINAPALDGGVGPMKVRPADMKSATALT